MRISVCVRVCVWPKVAQLRINILIGILRKLSRRRYIKFKLQIHLQRKDTDTVANTDTSGSVCVCASSYFCYL